MKRAARQSSHCWDRPSQRRLARVRSHLLVNHALVDPVLGDQLVVGATLHDAAVNQNQDLIGVNDRRQPVRDDEGRAALAQRIERRLHPEAADLTSLYKRCCWPALGLRDFEHGLGVAAVGYRRLVSRTESSARVGLLRTLSRELIGLQPPAAAAAGRGSAARPRPR